MKNFSQQVEQIRKNVLKNGMKKFGPRLEKVGREHFEKIRNFIIQRVNGHPLSVELRSHTNPSRYVGNGTLFGFLGFKEGSSPVDDLIKYLASKVIRRQKFSEDTYTSTIFFPNLSDMSKINGLKMPWMSGISWPEAVQSGVSGLGNFVPGNASEYSRSKEGLQRKSTASGFDMAPVSGYIDDILNEAKNIRIDIKI